MIFIQTEEICPFSLENRNITISSYNENVKLDNITEQSFVCMFKNCIDNYIYNSQVAIVIMKDLELTIKYKQKC